MATPSRNMLVIGVGGIINVLSLTWICALFFALITQDYFFYTVITSMFRTCPVPHATQSRRKPQRNPLTVRKNIISVPRWQYWVEVVLQTRKNENVLVSRVYQDIFGSGK